MSAKRYLKKFCTEQITRRRTVAVSIAGAARR
jgi:hypothetical protein